MLPVSLATRLVLYLGGLDLVLRARELVEMSKVELLPGQLRAGQGADERRYNVGEELFHTQQSAVEQAAEVEV